MSKQNKLKILVAGGRDFNDFQLMQQTVMGIILDRLMALKDKGFELNIGDVEIVSGGANGADTLAEQFADNMNFSKYIINADWNKHGKKAGILRNNDMADYCIKDSVDCVCICFWDSISKGTKHMIDIAKRHHIDTIIIDYLK